MIYYTRPSHPTTHDVTLDGARLANPGKPSQPVDPMFDIPGVNKVESSQVAAGGSMSLATAQTSEEFRICVINIEQKLHMGESDQQQEPLRI